ncbi:MAG: hypothetical protein MJH09_01365 [Cetobacterium sp.]|nr:hypothetical protein [Cetobacterium sp.]
MQEVNISKIKAECQDYINRQEIIVSGFCENNSNLKNKNTKDFQYVSLISLDGNEKIKVYDDKKKLLDGVFYRLKAVVYFQRTNEIALKDIEIIEEDKNNLIYNYRHFSILKTRLRKGMLNIEDYLTTLYKNKQIKIGIIIPSTSVAYEDIKTSIVGENRKYIKVLKEINIKEFLSLTLEEDQIDFWLITRGGGDLSLFNSYKMIEQISNLKKPVITALGHSTDYTLTDFMADKVFSTPTSFGEYLNNFFEKKEINESKEISLKDFKEQKDKIFNQSKEIEKLNRVLNIQKKELEEYKRIGNRLKEMEEKLNLNHSEFLLLNKTFSMIKNLVFTIIILMIIKIII